jgi:hypothetical protein
MENEPTVMQAILMGVLTGAGLGIGLTMGYALYLFSGEICQKINLLYWITLKRKRLIRIKDTPIFVGDHKVIDGVWYKHLGCGYFKKTSLFQNDD